MPEIASPNSNTTRDGTKRQAIPRQPSAGRKSGRVRRIASGSHCRSSNHGSAWRRYRRRLGAPWSGASKILQRLALRSVRECIGLSLRAENSMRNFRRPTISPLKTWSDSERDNLEQAIDDVINQAREELGEAWLVSNDYCS